MSPGSFQVERPCEVMTTNIRVIREPWSNNVYNRIMLWLSNVPDNRQLSETNNLCEERSALPDTLVERMI